VLRTTILLLLTLSVFPSEAAAQCALSGEANVDAVTPRGTGLTFGIAEEARVTLEGRRAHIEGLRPIAFVGTAASRDVNLFLASDRQVHGVLSLTAGLPVNVTRVRGRRAASPIDAGPVRIALSVPCDGLALVPPTSDAGAEEEEDDDWEHVVWVRGRDLQVFAGPTSADGVRLSLRAGVPTCEWPWLIARGAASGRIRVHATLADGMVLDGWVDRADVHGTTTVMTTCCDMGGMGSMCGHGYAGEVYRGSARIAAGTVLRDGEDRQWGRVVEDIDATIAISRSTVTTTSGTASAATTVTRVSETVWLESTPNMIVDSCGPIEVHVDRAAVTLPSER
jgi:hypothetical protein